MNNKISLGIVSAFVVLILGICTYEMIIADKTGPVITFSDKEITYTEGQSDDVLLDDVSARDAKDGDVSDTLMVANKVIVGNGEYIEVVYAAKDSKNNITTTKNKKRKVKYIAADNSADENKEDANGDEKLGDNANSDNASNENQTTENPGVTDNSPTGEIDKVAADASGIPVIKLKTTEATITVGEIFDEISYVRETYDNSGDVSRRIRVTGDYNLGVPGDYQLNYLVSDTDGNVSEPAPFILHIVAADNTQQQSTDITDNAGGNADTSVNAENTADVQQEQNVIQ